MKPELVLDRLAANPSSDQQSPHRNRASCEASALPGPTFLKQRDPRQHFLVQNAHIPARLRVSFLHQPPRLDVAFLDLAFKAKRWSRSLRIAENSSRMSPRRCRICDSRVVTRSGSVCRTSTLLLKNRYEFSHIRAHTIEDTSGSDYGVDYTAHIETSPCSRAP